MEQSSARPTVFISYSHKDKVWKDRLVTHLRVLEKQGLIDVWDDRRIDGGETWYAKIEKAMERAAAAVCLISADYLVSDFVNKEEIPYLLNRRERDGILLQPVLLHHCLWEVVNWLKPIQILPRGGQSVVEDFIGKEDVVFKQIARRVLGFLNGGYQPPLPEAPPWSPLPDSHIYIERPTQTGKEVFGRAEELNLLDEAWKSEDTNIVSLVAWGGVGKSALVNKWVAQMKAENFRGAERVYAWSFYSQGTGERVTSADLFVDQALCFFGDRQMANSNCSAWDKGRRLAELVQQQKTVLILDGLEPLQSGYEHDRGQVKDPALTVFLEELANKNPGLCVITTREQITGLLAPMESIIQKDLEQISSEAGRALLRVNDICGTDGELEEVTRDFGNHALAVNLVATYVHEFPGRHVSHARLIPDLDITEEQGKHPRRVMEAFAKRFGERPELNVLHIMGLFDRPATAKEIKWLRTRPPIWGLTDHICRLSDNDWNRVIENLRQKCLIAPPSHHNLGGLDAHPLVRQHFGQQLKETNEESWKKGHSHLYDYLSLSAPRLPYTVKAMGALCSAVTHGCKACRYQEALELYRLRMNRGKKNFHVDALGEMHADLAVLSNFFIQPWTKPVMKKGFNHSFLLSITGLRLRGMGLLKQAQINMEGGLSVHVEAKNWTEASKTARHLSNLYLIRGRLTRAAHMAEKSVKYAEDTRKRFERMMAISTLADTYHHAGDFRSSLEQFEEAEKIQQRFESKRRYLYRLQGCRYCDLLLQQGHFDEVAKRAKTTVNWCEKPSYFRTGKAMTYVIGARADLLKGNLNAAEDHVNSGLKMLREAGQADKLPLGLIARAALYRAKKNFRSARRDLDEALALVTRCEMRLYETDCHLEYARLNLTEGHIEKARENWEEAKQMVEEMGYHRRDAEVLLIEAELELREGDKKTAGQTLAEAKKCIDDMGCHRWDIEVERIKKELED